MGKIKCIVYITTLEKQALDAVVKVKGTTVSEHVRLLIIKDIDRYDFSALSKDSGMEHIKQQASGMPVRLALSQAEPSRMSMREIIGMGELPTAPEPDPDPATTIDTPPPTPIHTPVHAEKKYTEEELRHMSLDDILKASAAGVKQ